MNVIFVNGPPDSGKDEVDMILSQSAMCYYAHRKEKMAGPLRMAACAFYGIRDDMLDEEKRKDPRIRKFLIGLSEDVIKPLYGMDFFGVSLADRLMSMFIPPINVLVTDAGFDYEVIACAERLNKLDPGSRFELWQVNRPGHTFEGDSRGWVRLPPTLGYTRILDNTGSLADLKSNVLKMLEHSAWETQ